MNICKKGKHDMTEVLISMGQGALDIKHFHVTEKHCK